MSGRHRSSTVLGVAARLTVGAGALTDTVADCVALPRCRCRSGHRPRLALSAPVADEPLTPLAAGPPAGGGAGGVRWSMDQVKVAKCCRSRRCWGWRSILTVAGVDALMPPVVD